MLAYRCLVCGCVHGWIDNPLVMKVEKHIRLSMEDIWYCPRCNREHRTWDGTWLGQLEKKWEKITDGDYEEKNVRVVQDDKGNWLEIHYQYFKRDVKNGNE